MATAAQSLTGLQLSALVPDENVPALHGLHTRLLVEVAAVLTYSPAEHCVAILHHVALGNLYTCPPRTDYSSGRWLSLRAGSQ